MNAEHSEKQSPGVGSGAWFGMGGQPIETAPKDIAFIGRETYIERFTGKRRYHKRRTWWGKMVHVPLYGWCWCRGQDVENADLWQPTHWRPLPNSKVS